MAELVAVAAERNDLVVADLMVADLVVAELAVAEREAAQVADRGGGGGDPKLVAALERRRVGVDAKPLRRADERCD